ncbi:MAG: hypothetical protein AB7G75_15430 [Candidatus Binatia bacterium]
MPPSNVAVRTVTTTAAPITTRYRSETPEVFCPPEQFYTPANADQWAGARRLLLAVLQDAIADWFRYQSDHTTRGRRLYQETQEWFSSRDKSWLYAFETICDHLNLDAEYIRHGLATSATPGRNTRMVLFRRAPVPARVPAPRTPSSSGLVSPRPSLSARRQQAHRHAHIRQAR